VTQQPLTHPSVLLFRCGKRGEAAGPTGTKGG
jgi:hypothetical protein